MLLEIELHTAVSTLECTDLHTTTIQDTTAVARVDN